jgi:hypothetical protein
MGDDCNHEKLRMTVDTDDGGTEEVCPICDQIDMVSLDDE